MLVNAQPMKSRTVSKQKFSPEMPHRGNGKHAETNGTIHTDAPSDSMNAQELLRVLTEVKNGNLSVRMPIDEVGMTGKIFDTLNEIISLNEKMMQEFTRAGST